MVRVLDVATQTAVRDRSRVIIRNFVLATVKDLDDDSDEVFGFTDFGEDVILNVIDGETGSSTSRTYAGDGGPLLRMDPVPLKIGLEVDTTQIVLSQIHAAVQSMARGPQYSEKFCCASS